MPVEAVLQHFAVARETEQDRHRLQSNFEKSGEESEEEIEGFMLEACSGRSLLNRIFMSGFTNTMTINISESMYLNTSSEHFLLYVVLLDAFNFLFF